VTCAEFVQAYQHCLLFQILFSTWFFKRPSSGPAPGQAEGGGAEEEGAEQASARSSRLANLLLRQFSVRTDFRDLNISVPQSM